MTNMSVARSGSSGNLPNSRRGHDGSLICTWIVRGKKHQSSVCHPLEGLQHRHTGPEAVCGDACMICPLCIVFFTLTRSHLHSCHLPVSLCCRKRDQLDSVAVTSIFRTYKQTRKLPSEFTHADVFNVSIMNKGC